METEMQWSNEVWHGRVWSEDQTEPCRQERRELAQLDWMESQWREAQQENLLREWVNECAVTGTCTVCGLGPQTACESSGSCYGAMREWRGRG